MILSASGRSVHDENYSRFTPTRTRSFGLRSLLQHWVPALPAGAARLSAAGLPRPRTIRKADRRCRLADRSIRARASPNYPAPIAPLSAAELSGAKRSIGRDQLSRDRNRAVLGPGDRPRPDLHRPRQQCQRVAAGAYADQRRRRRNLPDVAAGGEHRPPPVQRRDERPQLSRHGRRPGRRPAALSRLRRADRLFQ